MQKQPKIEFHKEVKHINYWKWTTLGLLAIIIAFCFVIGVRLSQERESVPSMPSISVKGDDIFTVTTTKKELNTLIGHYLKEINKKTPVDYQFTIENQALLTGKFEVLNFPMTFYLYFDPYVTEDGNIQLKAKSLSIGSLGVPMKEVLKMVKRSYDLPKFVEIYPDEKYVLIKLNKLQLSDNLYLKAKKIDLVNDEFQLVSYLKK